MEYNLRQLTANIEWMLKAKKVLEEEMFSSFPIGTIIKLGKENESGNRFMKVAEYLAGRPDSYVPPKDPLAVSAWVVLIEWYGDYGKERRSRRLNVDYFEYEQLKLPTAEDVAELFCSPKLIDRELGEYLAKNQPPEKYVQHKAKGV
jgi:hypothetical protein